MLLLLIMTATAWLTHKYSWSFDWTRDNRNSLSQTSRDVLREIDQPVVITILADLAANKRNIYRRKIAKYQRYKKDISLRFLDADKQIEEAKELRLSNAGQIRIDYAERHEILNQASEAEISNALQRLRRNEKPWLGFLTGHGERDPFQEDKQGLSTLRKSLETSGIHVQDFNLLETTTIPDNIAALVLAAPQSKLLMGEEKLIIEYLQAGGNLLWLQDPNRGEQSPSLNQALGVSWIAGTIIDANKELRSILGIQHPAVVPVVEYQAHAITKKLKNQTLYPFATAFEVSEEIIGDQDWQVQPLFYSLPRAWSETATSGNDNAVFSTADGDTAGPLLMAAAYSRQLAETSQRVIVVGDSDFMANAYIGHGENLALSSAMLQWLLNDDEGLTLLPYQPPDISIQLSDSAILSLASAYLLVLPLSVLIIGIAIARRRRKA